jgi:hypothetical protein
VGFIRNLAERASEFDRARENIDDEKTTNRYLRSLRRHNRVLDEEQEIEYLKNRIKEREHARASLLSKAKEEKSGIIKKKIEILKERQFMIPRNKPKHSMFSRGNL